MTEKRKRDWTGPERRRSARVDAQIALQLSGDDAVVPGESITTESINVGSEGVYCPVSHFVAPLTKLQVTMVLPMKTKKGQLRNEVVKADAVVVRCQPAGGASGGYRIALFFTGLEAQTRQVLDEYVRQHAADA
jgi:NAD(P)H-dependent flavin oxidoreductase YrpB (nitropropane dioxygenase family)